MVTELKNKDEFMIFKDCLNAMKANNPENASELINSLPNHKKEFLRDIFQSQQVAIDSTGQKTESRKIVKPRARKIASNIKEREEMD